MSNEQNFDDFLKKTNKNRRTKWIVAGLIVLFFIALIFISADWVLGALVHTRKEVTVPDLTKKSVTQALGLLASNNLALKQAGVEFAKEVAPGSVLRQLPSAGSTVREGRVIRVWISQGDEMVFVPNTVGTDLRSAQLAVRQAGLLVDKVDNAYSLTYEKGLIVAQTPKSVFPSGTVAAQNPAEDSQIAPGTNLEVTVSRRQAGEDEKSYHLHYEMPQGKNASRVRVVLEQGDTENEILNETRQPGSKIDLEVPFADRATLRVFVDGILVRERELQ